MHWPNMMMNPKVHNLKKLMFEFLKEKFAQNEQIIERVSSSLVTDTDYNDFIKLVTNIYEIAYMKCVADHREQLQKVGLTANVVGDRHLSKDG